MKKILNHIAKKQELKLIDIKPLYGGDINHVFHLITEEGDFVVKLNKAKSYPQMFEAEECGLNLLLTSNTFVIPEVRTLGVINETSYLMMEFIEKGESKIDFWEIFGQLLANLHKNTASSYGLKQNNYIGSLPQYNESHSSAEEFYILQRLEPQFKMAVENGYAINQIQRFYTQISKEIPQEPSALIHGDLWSGNYMVSTEGQPVLIDPAVAYAPREMDIAMMHLFGGFSNQVFDVYDLEYPLAYDWKSRMDIWQLYYLLVHLNLFGVGYLNRVVSIVKKYI